MRKIFAVTIIFCIFYFLVGWIAAHFGFVTKEDYFAYAGIVGGLASVAGLLGLTRPAITQSDVQAIEIDALKSMTATAEQLKILQTQRLKTAEEIDSLAVKKKEMELLVKKASLALFLKEQYFHHERQVLDEIEKNDRLQEALNKTQEISQKIAALNEEIEAHANVDQLKEIITSASKRESTLDTLIADLPFFPRSIFLVIRAISQLFVDSFRITIR